jgi:hypothetical protein
MRSFWKLTRVYGAILKFYTKNLRAVHELFSVKEYGND